MALSILPDPPARSDPANFAARGDAFMAALPTFVSEFNAQVPNVVAGDQGVTGNLTVNGLTGLGTTSAGARLDVVETGGGARTAYFTKGASDPGFRLGFMNGTGTGVGTEQGALTFDFVGSGSLASVGFLRGNSTNSDGIVFSVASERARIDSSGNLLVGTTSNTSNARLAVVGPTFSAGAVGVSIQAGALGDSLTIHHTNAGATPNAAQAAMLVPRSASTSRSINAAGTVNASGADYAEYEHNNGLKISKGSLVGFKQDGTLTDVFAEAIRFGVKSTDPSYVGGDVWGNAEAVGVKPDEPAGATPEQLAEYQSKLAEFETKLEQARQLVDRIAYSGKVPCNVQASSASGYIIAAADTNGKIIGKHITDCTFEQYKLAVGRVNRLLPDNRCEIAVMVH